MRTKADKKPTWTHKVVEALGTLDDFATTEQLIAMTGGTSNQIRAALHWLKKARVIEGMESDGRLWWYLTGDDLRSRAIEERVPEEKGRRKRGRPPKVPQD